MVSSIYNVTDHTKSQSCPECGTYTLSYDDSCLQCDLDFCNVFMPDTVATYNIDQIIADNNSFVIDTSNENPIWDIDHLYEIYLRDEVSQRYAMGEVPSYHHKLCCNSAKCNCPNKVEFDEAVLYYEDQQLLNSNIEIEDAMYFTKPGTESPLCASCIYFGKYTCKPYRTALRLAYFNPLLLESFPTYLELVEPCYEYDASATASVSEIKSVLVHINKASKVVPTETDALDDLDDRTYYHSYDTTYWE